MWKRRFAFLRRKLGLKVTEYRYYKLLLLPKLYTYMGFYFCFCQALPPRQQDLRSDLTEWRRRMILYSTALIRFFCACSLSEPSWNVFVVLNKWNTFPAIRLIQLKTLRRRRPKIKIFPSHLTSRLSYLGRYGNCCWIDLLVDYCKCSLTTNIYRSPQIQNCQKLNLEEKQRSLQDVTARGCCSLRDCCTSPLITTCNRVYCVYLQALVAF